MLLDDLARNAPSRDARRVALVDASVVWMETVSCEINGLFTHSHDTREPGNGVEVFGRRASFKLGELAA
jgi:hypothetical protein